MKRVLITGAEGFVASYLIQRLAKSYLLYGTYFLKEIESVESLFLDITDPDRVSQMVSEIKPDIIYHLAAQSSGGLSFSKTMMTYSINVQGTLNLLEAARISVPDAVIIIPTSADIYGSPDYLPLDEKHPLKPVNPYAASKAAVHIICENYSKTFGMKIVEARSFNHIGRGQAELFFIPSIVKQIKNCSKTDRRIQAGNIDIKRDFSDVRDVVEAYELMINAESGVYNVCSGQSLPLRGFIDHLIEYSGKNIIVDVNNAMKRDNEPEDFYGSYKKLNSAVGWKPKADILKTLEWIYDGE